MDERTPQFDDDAAENIEGEDYSFVDAESDEYVHTEWFEEEDEYLDSSRYYEQSGGETESSMDYDSGGIKYSKFFVMRSIMDFNRICSSRILLLALLMSCRTDTS
ncbi:hypothetical protein AAHE18_18G082900 [Arachis hypogaea]